MVASVGHRRPHPWHRHKIPDLAHVQGRHCHRCGWFDGVLVRQTIKISGIEGIALTKLDVLDQLEEIQICVAYEHHGERIRYFPTEISMLSEVEPIYEVHSGWKTNTSQIQNYENLPEQAKSYLRRLSEVIGTDISIISLGPARSETIILEESPRLQELFS